MSREEFEKLIKTLGFEFDFRTVEYVYKGFRIFSRDYDYDFYNGSDWGCDFTYYDLKPIEKYFKKGLRTIKLKQILE